jgi:hypothetical protein
MVVRRGAYADGTSLACSTFTGLSSCVAGPILFRFLQAVARHADTRAEGQQSKLFAMDMHEAFKKAVRGDQALAHVAIVHDPFHVLNRAGEEITELRRQVFFRATTGIHLVLTTEYSHSPSSGLKRSS